MAKRVRSQRYPTSVRLDPNVTLGLTTAAAATNWSFSRTVDHMVALGFAVAAANQERCAELVDSYRAAVKVRVIELRHAEELDAAHEKLTVTKQRIARRGGKQ